MNIPTTCPKTLKRREREIGGKIEEKATESCEQAAKEEWSKTSEGEKGITVSYDMGWQKRGTGKSYNSLPGIGHMLGHNSGKLVGVCTFSKRCTVCERAKARGEQPNHHSCRHNWQGLAKSMEPTGAVNIANNLQKKGISVARVIGDDDVTTISHLRKHVNPDMEKTPDLNHVKKNL